MKKKMTAAVLACMLAMGGMPVFAEETVYSTAGGEYRGMSWSLENGVLTVSGEGEIYNQHGFPDEDTCVHPDWNAYSNEITKVVLEEGITGAGPYTFSYFPVLESVELPSTMQTLSVQMFYKCASLQEVKGLEYVESIGMQCFMETPLTEEDPYIVVDGVLKYYEYQGHMGVLTVPDGVTEIGPDAFGNLSWMDSDYSDPFLDGVEDMFFTIVLPDTVVKIDDYAFRNLCMLTEIRIPDSVTEIGDYAFANCLRLKKLTLGEQVESVGDKAFYNCKSLYDLTVLNAEMLWGEKAYGYGLDQMILWEADEATRADMEAQMETTPFLYDEVMGNILTSSFWGDEGYMNWHTVEITESDAALLAEAEYVLPDHTLNGYTVSTTRTYAEENGVAFLALDGEEIVGDCNGDGTRNIVDVIFLNRCIMGADVLHTARRTVADCNGDGMVNAADSMALLRLLVAQ